jgi:hypothetical protein
MQMRPEVQIASVIKTMTDVIIPAIDPANRLAIEQSQLIIGLLSLLNTQLPLQFRFDRDELGRLLANAETLKATPANDPGTRAALDKLAVISAAACTVLDRCTLDPVLLTQSVRDMRVAMGSVVVAAAGTADLDTQLRVEKIVLNMSKDQLLRDRSLMKMQGWEADPAALPDIEDLLAQH